MWGCDECAHDRALRRLRGDCGRFPISPALPGASVDPVGRVGVRGDVVVAGAKGAFGEHVWDRCPVAMSRRHDVRRLVDLHCLRERGLDHSALSAQGRMALLIRAAELDAAQAAQEKTHG